MTLPLPPAAAGHYQAVIIRNGLGFVAGQLPFQDGRLVHPGRLGAELSFEEARQAAVISAVNVLAQIEQALGTWTRFGGLLRIDGYVASAEGRIDQAAVLDSASEFFVEQLGALGQHTRAAIVVPRLPLDASVELVATFAVHGGAELPPTTMKLEE